jgi:hypothetical protein
MRAHRAPCEVTEGRLLVEPEEDGLEFAGASIVSRVWSLMSRNVTGFKSAGAQRFGPWAS